MLGVTARAIIMPRNNPIVPSPVARPCSFSGNQDPASFVILPKINGCETAAPI